MLRRKEVDLTATAPGPRGGMGALQAAEERFPRHGGILLGSFSLPHFNENFDKEIGIIHSDLKFKFEEWLDQLVKSNL